MQKPKHMRDRQKQKRSSVDWGGLGNEPRNEKLAGIRGPTSFEKNGDNQDTECGASLSHRFKKHKGKGPRDK